MSHVGATKLRWEPLDLNRLRPHHSGKTVVVGHTPLANGNLLDLGFLIAIDTDCCRGGWLTALEARNKSVNQARETPDGRQDDT
jgi:serine/threonine protein phosphatase 1